MSDVNRLVNTMRYRLAENFVDAFIVAQRTGIGRQSKQFKYLAEALAADAIPHSLRTRIHQDLGDSAKRSVVDAFTHRPGRHRLSPYREGNHPKKTRYAGGKLRRALNDPRNVQASPNGLRFINADVLNGHARHWRRLNFGAGAAAGARPGTFPIDMFQVSIGLTPDPRPAFALPPGFWLMNGERQAPGAQGTGEFYPRNVAGSGARGARGRANRVRMTRGIQASNFLDAGVASIARNIGPAYQTMYREFYNDVVSRTNFEKRIGVKAPRPRAF